MEECIEIALGVGGGSTCSVILFHASMGHDFDVLARAAARLAPGATVVGNSCCGIIGREGVSESMKDVAIMTIDGPKDELAVAHVTDVFGSTAFAKGAELATALQAKLPNATMAYLLAPGIDISNDACLAGIESVLGPDITLFGGSSCDNMRGVANFQVAGGEVHQHAAFLIGFADPTLRVLTMATHGFVPVGEPMIVTRSEGNRILELDGAPAWTTYTSKLGLAETATCGDSIPTGALAEELPPKTAAEYGNSHILRVVTSRTSPSDGSAMHYPTECPVGTRLWLTQRDEERIFSEMGSMMKRMTDGVGSAEVMAVFHADCLARGKFLFNRVLKEELVSRMQGPLATHGAPPPWIGMYGFGEFARLGGRNEYHNYTTAIAAIFRSECE